MEFFYNLSDSYFERMKYAIQYHKSKNPHYDLRLEYNGVARSWAIRKSPLEEGKRLAIQVEDHEIDYMNWEGTIPEGEYGAGTVEIWDSGEYEIESWKEDEKIVLEIFGEKLKGKYVLVRFKNVPNGWLFFKKNE